MRSRSQILMTSGQILKIFYNCVTLCKKFLKSDRLQSAISADYAIKPEIYLESVIALNTAIATTTIAPETVIQTGCL